MCFGCWEEAGRPAVANGRTLAAVPLIAAVYEESCVGGALHVVLDDWNLEDADVNWCAKEASTEAEKRCAAAFAAMAETERASALAFYEGFAAAPPPLVAE